MRRAADRTDRSALPVALRPFAGWKPERLTADLPRRAIAEALATDAGLREAVGEALDDRGLWDEAESADTSRLVERYGEEAAVAGLAARGRWDDLAVVAATSAERLAAEGRAATEAARRQGAATDLAARRRLADELGAARSERDALRRRAEGAEQRERAAVAERRRLADQVSALEARAAELTGALAGERRRAVRQGERLRRRLFEAEERVRVDDTRVDEVASRLEGLVGELRSALRAESSAPTVEVERAEPSTVAAPSLPAATPGRPCRLPPGLSEDDPLGVEALLRVPGIAVVLDGYNLTKDTSGRPALGLPEQRAWLLAVAGGVAARFDRRLTVVFDGTEVMRAPVPVPRGVTVSFSEGEENADDRIVAIVEALDPDQPVLVATTDREVRDDCADLGANVVSSRAFLRAARA